MKKTHLRRYKRTSSVRPYISTVHINYSRRKKQTSLDRQTSICFLMLIEIKN